MKRPFDERALARAALRAAGVPSGDVRTPALSWRAALRRLALGRQLSGFRQAAEVAAPMLYAWRAMMQSVRGAESAELLQTRERLQVGRRFLMLRPRIALLGVLGNAVCLALAPVPPTQRLLLALSLGAAVTAFFLESAWLAKRALSERWLFVSLVLTLLTLAFGTLLSGGLASPMTPLLFAPTVVGFAAFARSRQSALLFGATLAALALSAWLGPISGFAAPPQPWSARMLLISCVLSLSLLALGVISLVDAHARIAGQLERMRTDMLREAELRAVSVEQLGARVAHDVKNPLTAVRGLVQLVQRASAGRDQDRLGVALGELDRALEVLHGYLSLARPLRDLTLAQTDLRALLDDVAGVVEARALERGIVLRVHGVAHTLAVERNKLRDALLNLALNAIAAMPRGGQLNFALDAQGNAATITVEDTGAGMSEAELAQLGQAFVSGHEGGTGLGVLLARSAIEQHRGTLTFTSQQGRGTRALLTLPRTESPR
jgi:signal transduction histidine kinase